MQANEAPPARRRAAPGTARGIVVAALALAAVWLSAEFAVSAQALQGGAGGLPVATPRGVVTVFGMSGLPPSETRISLRAQRIGATRWSTVRVIPGSADPGTLLEKLCRAMDLTLTMDPAARSALSRCRLNPGMFEAQPEKVILTLFRMLDPVPAVVYERHGSTIHVYPIALDRDHLPIRNVTLHYPAGTPFQKVMDALLAGTNIECAWMGSPGVAASGRVDLVNVPFRTALEAVLAQAKLPHGAHIHYVWNGSSLLDLSLRTDLPTSALGRRPITVKAVAMPLRRLLRGTFDLDADYSMEMAPDVTGTVTDSFAGLPLEEALPRVLHHSTVPAEMHVYQGDHRVGTGRIVVIRRGR